MHVQFLHPTETLRRLWVLLFDTRWRSPVRFFWVSYSEVIFTQRTALFLLPFVLFYTGGQSAQRKTRLFAGFLFWGLYIWMWAECCALKSENSVSQGGNLARRESYLFDLTRSSKHNVLVSIVYSRNKECWW